MRRTLPIGLKDDGIEKRKRSQYSSSRRTAAARSCGVVEFVVVAGGVVVEFLNELVD